MISVLGGWPICDFLIIWEAFNMVLALFVLDFMLGPAEGS
jgi:hypothetical protein